MTYVLGLNAYHGDASACIVRDGVLIAAAEEERFTRVKHWAGFPTQAIRFCLDQARIPLSAVNMVAVNQNARANFWRKASYTLSRRADLSLVLDRLRKRHGRSRTRADLSRHFPGQTLRAELVNVEHHLAHLGSAYLVSPFAEAAVLSVDGFGDFASTAWGMGSGDRVEIDGEVHFPHSLGIFYQALTQYLGFPHYGDEYKVMGLASYGALNHLVAMQDIVKLQAGGTFQLELRYFRHHDEQIGYEWESGQPTVGRLYSAGLEKLLGPARKSEEPLTQRHKDIARSVQAMYETALFHLLGHLHERYRCDRLALAGGCAMNSVANGKIYHNTPFKQLYVQSAAGDAGGAIGAAFIAWHRSLRDGSTSIAHGSGQRRFVMDHAYWGPAYDPSETVCLLNESQNTLHRAGCVATQCRDERDLAEHTAASIAAGLVVGWFQGRMEWGPRALGNRSIVCDPRRADMKEILNLKIKRRESFRPFAPSILREAVAEWFEVDDDVPFMTQVYPIRAEMRSRIPAVTHVDGTGRLQTVTRDANPRYYALIEAFRDLTGVPMVLNTSFNENEPVVCTPKEALDCFLRTKMDVLVMGNWMVRRA